eukprot:6182911-Prymnesium_polylepis.1
MLYMYRRSRVGRFASARDVSAGSTAVDAIEPRFLASSLPRFLGSSVHLVNTPGLAPPFSS